MTKQNLLKALKFTACNFYQFSKNLEKEKLIGPAVAAKIAYEQISRIIEDEKYCKWLAEMADKLNSPDHQEHHSNSDPEIH